MTVEIILTIVSAIIYAMTRRHKDAHHKHKVSLYNPIPNPWLGRVNWMAEVTFFVSAVVTMSWHLPDAIVPGMIGLLAVSAIGWQILRTDMTLYREEIEEKYKATDWVAHDMTRLKRHVRMESAIRLCMRVMWICATPIVLTVLAKNPTLTMILGAVVGMVSAMYVTLSSGRSVKRVAIAIAAFLGFGFAGSAIFDLPTAVIVFGATAVMFVVFMTIYALSQNDDDGHIMLTELASSLASIALMLTLNSLGVIVAHLVSLAGHSLAV